MKEVSIGLLHLCRMLFCYMLSLCDSLAAAPGYHILGDFVIVSDMGSLSLPCAYDSISSLKGFRPRHGRHHLFPVS